MNMRSLADLYQAYRHRGLEIIGFYNTQFVKGEFEDFPHVKEYIKKTYGIEFPLFENASVKGP